MQDPSKILQQCVDPPEESMVDAAIDSLFQMGAIDSEGSPTALGHLLCNMPVNLENANLVLRGAQKGLLRESILLASIQNSKPHPIAKPFCQEQAHHEYMLQFGSPDGSRSPQCDRMLAQACAYLRWRKKWGPSWSKLDEPRSLNRMGSELQEEMRQCKEEERWCEELGLVKSALLSVKNTMHILYEVLHKFQLPSLRSNDPSQLDHFGTTSKDIWGEATYQTLCALLKGDIRTGHENATPPLNQQSICRFFIKGNCYNGINCPYAHSEITKVACKFYASGCCNKGSKCEFLHSKDPSQAAGALNSVIPEFRGLKELNDQWPLPMKGAFGSWDRKVVLMGDGDCSFGVALGKRCLLDPSPLL